MATRQELYQETTPASDRDETSIPRQAGSLARPCFFLVGRRCRLLSSCMYGVAAAHCRPQQKGRAKKGRCRSKHDPGIWEAVRSRQAGPRPHQPRPCPERPFQERPQPPRPHPTRPHPTRPHRKGRSKEGCAAPRRPLKRPSPARRPHRQNTAPSRRQREVRMRAPCSVIIGGWVSLLGGVRAAPACRGPWGAVIVDSLREYGARGWGLWTGRD